MNIIELLSPERIQCKAPVTSKKRAMEMLSALLAQAEPGWTQGEIFDGLLSRERLGSTGMGQGVAIPHSRLACADKAVGALLTLEEGIDFDAADQGPVDLIFALVVPEDSSDEHLQILSQLAQMFTDRHVVAELRQCNGPSAVLERLNRWNASHAA